jgi:hypothetical protein
MGVETGLDSRWPGQVKVDLGPIVKAGSKGIATALIVAIVWVLDVGGFDKAGDSRRDERQRNAEARRVRSADAELTVISLLS